MYPVRLSGNVLLSTVSRTPQTCQPYYSTKCKHLFEFWGGRLKRGKLACCMLLWAAMVSLIARVSAITSATAARPIPVPPSARPG